MIPDKFVVGIGAQRAGSTWLYDLLNSHPEIQLAHEKEIHHFNNLAFGAPHNIKLQKDKLDQLRKFPQENSKLIEWYSLLCERINTDDWYRSLFCDKNINYRKSIIYTGEVTPAYAILDEYYYRQLKNCFPQVKVIFILRNPVDRIWSMARVSHERGQQVLTDTYLRDLLNDEGTKLRTQYDRTIRSLQSTFSEDNILLIFFEELFSDSTLNRLSEFLNLDNKFSKNFNAKVNSSKEIGCPDWFREKIVNDYQIMVNNIKKSIGYIPQSWMKYF